MKLLSNIEPLWAGAPSCINQMSRLIFPHASRIYFFIKHLSVIDSSQRSFIEKGPLTHPLPQTPAHKERFSLRMLFSKTNPFGRFSDQKRVFWELTVPSIANAASSVIINLSQNLSCRYKSQLQKVLLLR